MADVRSLLRQQRDARRIDHPHAAYSDAGKLLCTLCREPVRAEKLWEAHLQTASHKRRVAEPPEKTEALNKADGHDSAEGNVPLQEQAPAPNGKRKHSGDVSNGDVDVDMDDLVRRKRSRADIASADDEQQSATTGSGTTTKEQTLTPPTLARRTSTTPSQGIELQIPSRPVTPATANREGSSSATPITASSRQQGSGADGLPETHGSHTNGKSRSSMTASTTAHAPETSATGGPQVDEGEWAAFEADIAASSNDLDASAAVISAPAMSAAESAAAKAADQAAADERRRAQVDVDIEDEREDATRALETEFEEMEELEARVQRLKQKREELHKKRAESISQEGAEKLSKGSSSAIGKENLETAVEEEDDDEDDEDDDWDGFRFRTA